MSMGAARMTMIFRIRVRIASLLVSAAEKLAYLARKVAPRW
jgi:hypothetical protein